MRGVTIIVAALTAAGLSAQPAFAGTDAGVLAWPQCRAFGAPRVSPWCKVFPIAEAVPGSGRLRVADAGSQAAPVRRRVPVEYSEAYKVRAKIHKVASFVTLPLFVTNYIVGQDLYNNPGQSESKNGLHGALAATTGVLFGINSVTGAWNLWEGRKDANHRGRRLTHGILMMVADAGFLATGLLAPESEEQYTADTGRRNTHRTVARTSMGIATVSYLIMRFGGN